MDHTTETHDTAREDESFDNMKTWNKHSMKMLKNEKLIHDYYIKFLDKGLCRKHVVDF